MHLSTSVKAFASDKTAGKEAQTAHHRPQARTLAPQNFDATRQLAIFALQKCPKRNGDNAATTHFTPLALAHEPGNAHAAALHPARSGESGRIRAEPRFNCRMGKVSALLCEHLSLGRPFFQHLRFALRTGNRQEVQPQSQG